MNKKFLLLVWGVAVVAQLGVVARMITTQETILREGVAYRFRTAPVDPYDAFRGRYVAIALEPSVAPRPDGLTHLKRGDEVFVLLGTDTTGYAEILGASVERPQTGDYLRVTTSWVQNHEQMGVRYPMDRYYLPEDEAPRAEQLYREHSRRGRQDAHVVLKIRSGEAVAEDLVIGDRSIRDWLKEDVVDR
jgi:uncharacterized membrane-anchored protein